MTLARAGSMKNKHCPSERNAMKRRIYSFKTSSKSKKLLSSLVNRFFTAFRMTSSFRIREFSHSVWSVAGARIYSLKAGLQHIIILIATVNRSFCRQIGIRMIKRFS